MPKSISGFSSSLLSNLQYPGPDSVLFLTIVHDIGLWSDRLDRLSILTDCIYPVVGGLAEKSLGVL